MTPYLILAISLTVAGTLIMNVMLVAVSQRTAEVGAGYMGHGWMHVRHPDYDECRRILDYIGETVKLWAA